MILNACSTTPVQTQIKLVDRVVRDIPPNELLMQCDVAVDAEFKITRDIIESRRRWITAYCLCSFRVNRLVQWHSNVVLEIPKACKEIVTIN